MLSFEEKKHKFFGSVFDLLRALNSSVGLAVTTDEETCEPEHEISNNVVRATSKASDQPAHIRSLIRAFASRLNSL